VLQGFELRVVRGCIAKVRADAQRILALLDDPSWSTSATRRP
jgi:hypothetical protein